MLFVFYFRYKKIAGDTCAGGYEHRFGPLMYACRASDGKNITVFTQSIGTSYLLTILVLKFELGHSTAS